MTPGTPQPEPEPAERAEPDARGRPPAISLEGAAKRFGWTWALRGIDLEVERGSLVALMGPNGAGKTTLLRLLATLIHPTAGTARVLGMDVAREAEEIRRVLGFLPPQGYLYHQLTALENLRFACMMSGTPREHEHLARVLDRVGLGHVAGERVGGYSSGMRQRLALARLLLRDVEVVLLDEPYGSLDVDGVELVDEIVGELLAEDRTVVLASHQWTRALRSAGSVVLLEDGRVSWEGSADVFLRERAGGRLSGVPGPPPEAGAGGGEPPAEG